MKKIQLTIAWLFVWFVLAVAVKAEVRIGGESWAGVDTAGPSKYDHVEWQDPLVFAVNRLPPRNPAWPNPDSESGWKSDYQHSPWLQSLDGPWSFHWSSRWE